ncbi:MAG: cholesterol oxidase [Myxococcota bacterium]|jgi:cholesterol oxidase
MSERNTRDVSRRSFLGWSAGTVAALSLPRCAQQERGPRGDAIVIGSGFGGSIAALRLAQAGVSVTVLERGRRWPITSDGSTFPSLLEPDQRAAWLSTTTALPGAPSATFEPYAGLLERFRGDGMDVIRAAAVGGASLVFGGIMVTPPRSLFESIFPREVSYSDLERTYYPRVREMMRVSRIPDDILNSGPYESTRIFLDQANKAGLDTVIIENAIDWDLIRAELDGRHSPQAIVGEYNYGLNSGAKNSLDRNYLADAEATGRVDVRPLHRVTGISEDPPGGYTVTAERIDEHGTILESITLSGRYLVLGAGSIGSTGLLLKARSEGTLPRLPVSIGEGWSNNGQNILFRGGLGVDTGAYQGGPPTAFARHLDNPIGPVSIENGPGPIGFECQCLIHIGHGVTTGVGSMSWDRDAGALKLTWDASHNTQARDAALHTLDLMNQANGGQVVAFPGFEEPATYHPLGGAVMGQACDTFGRVHGHPGLYVVDGALIPGSVPTANPALTIAAIAERCLDDIVANDLG